MNVGKLVSVLESSIAEKLADDEGIIQDETMEEMISKQTEIDNNLQVVREALIALMKHFSTFNPLLRKMMDAYESALRIRDRRLEGCLKLTNSLPGFGNDVKDPVSEMDRMGNRGLNDLATEKSSLISKIEFLNTARSEQEDCIRKLRKKLTDSEQQVKRELENRRLVLREIENLERKMNLLQKRVKIQPPSEFDIDFDTHEMKRMRRKVCTREDDKTSPSLDPLNLEKMLNTCQTNERELLRKLCSLQNEYSEFVPLKKFEAAESRVRAMVLEKNKLNETITALRSEKKDILEIISHLKGERKSLTDRVDDLENGSSIIDSQWKRCANCFPGGIKRWRKLTSGKNNGEKLEILVNEFEIMAAMEPYYEENVMFTEGSSA